MCYKTILRSKKLRNMEVIPCKFASDLLKRNKDIAGKEHVA